MNYMECPCCGCEGAIGPEYYDGDPLECGCAGQVSCSEGEAYIAIDTSESCPKHALCHRSLADEAPQVPEPTNARRKDQ